VSHRFFSSRIIAEPSSHAAAGGYFERTIHKQSHN
jgi:hypothetical protein